VFTRGGASGISLWTMNDDGSDPTRLTDGGLDLSPAPSPSGKQVAFVRFGDIHVLHLETGVLTNVTNTLGVFELTPAWSPSGKQIACAIVVAGQQSDIYVMNGRSCSRDHGAVRAGTSSDPRSEALSQTTCRLIRSRR
jgi:Tol biopolymer transport system component